MRTPDDELTRAELTTADLIGHRSVEINMDTGLSGGSADATQLEGKTRLTSASDAEIDLAARTRLTSSADEAPTEADGGTRVSAVAKPPETGDEALDRIGKTLGSYLVKRIIGRGGMGCVYEAEHTKLGRPVALKVLNSDYAKRRDAVARFFQEARAVNQIRHSNIVDVTDLVELDDGTTFIIMELLEGANITQHMNRGRMGTTRALGVLIQICDALGAAHAHKIIHRDLKPDNIVVKFNDDGPATVKLCDFGVAKLLNPDTHQEGLTAAGCVVGTPAFMSPEQAAGLKLDHRSDIYSLGAIMYELFCEQPLFRGRSFGEYIRLHLEKAPLHPSKTKGADQISGELADIILRCLQKSPDRRYQNAADLRKDLVGLLSAEEAELLTIDSGLLHTDEDEETLLAPTNRRGSVFPVDVEDDDEKTLMTPARGFHTPSVGMETAMVFGDVPSRQPRSRRSAGLWVGGIIALAAVAGVALAISEKGATTDTAASVTESSPDTTEIPSPAAEVKPLATPEEKMPVVAVVKVTSTPTAKLFQANEDTPRCKTPCELEVTTVAARTKAGTMAFGVFRLVAEGHELEPFNIDLTNPPPAIHRILKPIAPIDAGVGSTVAAADPKDPKSADEPPAGADKTATVTKTTSKKKSPKRPSGKKTAKSKPSGKKNSGKDKASSTAKPKCKKAPGGKEALYNPFGKCK
jgi:serine/threonine-protein kinase